MTIRGFPGTLRFLARMARHSLLGTLPLSLPDRLAMLPAKSAPVERPVAIHWDAHHIPFIEAETDTDLATAIGIVQAHLRLGQMEMFRRLSQGRVAETIGGIGLGIDRLIRAFDIARAVSEIERGLPAETRTWLEAFVRGINHVIARTEHLPPEFALFALRREAWSVPDVLRLGRLISADINWIVWLRLLPFRASPGWHELWGKLIRADALAAFSDGGEFEQEALGRAALRSGSNSFAVAASRSASGGALIASDPHLSITLPNLWLIAGTKSPSHHAVGLMIPGIPFIGLGRSRFLAWGGTSLHAASSDLLALPAGTEMTERSEIIRISGATDRTFTMRDCAWGPVIGDQAPFRRGLKGNVALRWVGHRPSDEFTAMLAIGRARTWEDVKQALKSYAVPGLAMNFASISGGVAQFTAAQLPQRDDPFPADIVAAADGWESLLDAWQLPAGIDPARGFIASANARPNENRPVIGFLFSPPARRDRISELLKQNSQIGIADMIRIQRDVHRNSALAERDCLLAWAAEAKIAAQTGPLAAIPNWNGDYDADSKGALAFELLFYHLACALVIKRKRRAYAAAWANRELIWSDIRESYPEPRAAAMRTAVRRAARDFRPGATWGSRHRIRLAHMLGAIPIAGRRWRALDIPASGTSETIMKTAHPMTNRRHAARYGSVARHISDMADPDANFFALLGGNDGWLGSTTAIDQAALWQAGEYICVPLSPETVRTTFAHQTVLTP